MRVILEIQNRILCNSGFKFLSWFICFYGIRAYKGIFPDRQELLIRL